MSAVPLLFAPLLLSALPGLTGLTSVCEAACAMVSVPLSWPAVSSLAVWFELWLTLFCVSFGAGVAATSFNSSAKGDASSALPTSAFDGVEDKIAAAAILDVADARKKGNPMIIRHNPSQRTGQMPAPRIWLDFLDQPARQAA